MMNHLIVITVNYLHPNHPPQRHWQRGSISQSVEVTQRCGDRGVMLGGPPLRGARMSGAVSSAQLMQ